MFTVNKAKRAELRKELFPGVRGRLLSRKPRASCRLHSALRITYQRATQNQLIACDICSNNKIGCEMSSKSEPRLNGLPSNRGARPPAAGCAKLNISRTNISSFAAHQQANRKYHASYNCTHPVSFNINISGGHPNYVLLKLQPEPKPIY